jgi:hypothetical protein
LDDPGQEAPPKRPRKASKNQVTAAEIEEALAAYNEAARVHGFSRCDALTEDRRDRLSKRLSDIGGVARFRLALSALPRDKFLMGKVPPKPGQDPFRLTIERLLSTGSRLGDVLAHLIDLAGETPSERKPDAGADLDAQLEQRRRELRGRS